MTALQKIQLKMSEARSRLQEIAGIDEITDEIRSEVQTLKTSLSDLEVRNQAAIVSESEQAAANEQRFEASDGEGRELRELQGRVSVARYLGAAIETRSVDGAESEYNEALGMDRTAFPLRLLAPSEVRADTTTDAGATQGTWLDRIFGDTAASYIGVQFNSVAPGVASYPTTTAGATGAQRGKGQDVSDAAWTVGVTDLSPTRNAVRAIFNTVDSARLMGLEEALRRDLSMAMADAIDKVILSGDNSANPADGDIVGLRTATDVTEVTIGQSAKITGKGVTEALAEFIDGKHASMPEHLRIAASVASNTLWLSNLVQSGNSVDTSIAQYLRAHGLSWMTREGIDTTSTNGKFGGYVGLSRMQAGAGVAAVWDGGQLIRDPYSDAAGGTVALTLSYLWNFGLPRPASFGRIKYVT